LLFTGTPIGSFEAPLAFEDAFEVLGPALPGGEFVLVGGQALTFWLMLCRATEPSLNGLDALAAIPLHERLGEKFITEYLPRLRERAGS
jgi:hypothetical protein